MKNTTLTFYLFMVLSISPSYSQNKDGSMEKLAQSIKKFNDAFQNADTDILKSMLTENYKHTNGSSLAIGKDRWLAYIDQRKRDIQNGVLEVVDYKMDQMEIEVYGNTAIVTGRITTSVKKMDQVMEDQYRVTHLWALEGGQWKRAGFHDGKIP